MALKPGGGIRPGMMPLNKIVSLVSGTGRGWGWWTSTGQCPVPPAPSTSMAVDRLLLAFLQLPQAGGQAQIPPQFWGMRTQETPHAAAILLEWLTLS